MTVKDWQNFGSVDKTALELKAPWYKIVDYVAPNKLLQFVAEGEWTFFAGFTDKCSPDGFLGLPLPDARLPLPNAPVGALIGKIGGSTADQKDGTLFTIGSYTVFVVPQTAGGVGPQTAGGVVPQTAGGPLYFGLNTVPGAPILKLDKIKITVKIADP